MAAASAWASLQDRGESNQYQDDGNPEQVVATVVLVGVGDIAKERDRPANLVHVASRYSGVLRVTG
jgi:hypothetical protein